MAFKLRESWVNEAGTIVAVRRQDGSLAYYVTNRLTISDMEIKNHPVLAREISSFNLEMIEAKQRDK